MFGEEFFRQRSESDLTTILRPVHRYQRQYEARMRQLPRGSFQLLGACLHDTFEGTMAVRRHWDEHLRDHLTEGVY